MGRIPDPGGPHDPHPQRVAGLLDARRGRHPAALITPPAVAATCVATRQHGALRDVQRLAEPQRAGQLIADLSTPDNAQAATVAEIIQRVRPTSC